MMPLLHARRLLFAAVLTLAPLPLAAQTPCDIVGSAIARAKPGQYALYRMTDKKGKGGEFRFAVLGFEQHKGRRHVWTETRYEQEGERVMTGQALLPLEPYEPGKAAAVFMQNDPSRPPQKVSGLLLKVASKIAKSPEANVLANCDRLEKISERAADVDGRSLPAADWLDRKEKHAISVSPRAVLGWVRLEDKKGNVMELVKQGAGAKPSFERPPLGKDDSADDQ